MRGKDLAYIGLFTALIAICSWISIPTAVPFTLQTFAVFCAVGMLGGKRGTIAIGVYLLLGAIGVPVFAGFKGGVGALLGATGGYLLGFLLTGLVCWLTRRLLGSGSWSMVLGMAVGLLCCYAFGTAWFMAVYARTTGAIGLSAALGWCVLPFLLPDGVKLVLALVLTLRLRKVKGLLPSA